MLPLFAAVEWPSALVAIVLLVIFAAILIIAMFRYNLDDVLKLLGALGTLFGIVIGSIATYFFTNQAHEARTAQLQAEKQTLVAQHQAAVAEKEEWALTATAAQEREKRANEQALSEAAKAPRNPASPAAAPPTSGSAAAKNAAGPQ